MRMVSEKDVLLSEMGRWCLQEPACNFESRYRTYDGSCNNVRFPKFGQQRRVYSRILVNDYDDGEDESQAPSRIPYEPGKKVNQANSIYYIRHKRSQRLLQAKTTLGPTRLEHVTEFPPPFFFFQ